VRNFVVSASSSAETGSLKVIAHAGHSARLLVMDDFDFLKHRFLGHESGNIFKDDPRTACVA
jgi:hypothetical protein